MRKIEKLEALRGFAAIYVVVHHLGLVKYTKLGYLASQGQAAVMLFFVLSGFVIFLSVDRIQSPSSFQWKPYFVKRLRRIYPVFLVALLLAYITSSISSGKLLPLDGVNLLGNIFNLQDHPKHPGNWFKTYYENRPLWSLTYEWWFYILFIPLYKLVAPSSQKTVAVLLSVFGFLSYLVYPNLASLILEYFVIWWCGAELARSWISKGRIDGATMKYLGFSMALMLMLLGIKLGIWSDWDLAKIKYTYHPELDFRHFVYTAFILVFGLTWSKLGWIGYQYLLRPFAVFAPISYGIYLFHYPLMITILNGSLLEQMIGFVLTVALSYAVEVKLQKVINRKTRKYTVLAQKTD